MHEEFIASKDERRNHALGLSLLSMVLFGVTLWLSCAFWGRLAAMIGSILLFIPSVVLICRSGREQDGCFTSLILNSVANGLIISVYYLSYHLQLSWLHLPVLLLPVSMLVGVYFLVSCLKKAHVWVIIALILVHIALLVGAVVKWVQIGGASYSLCFFGLIFSFFYSIVLVITTYRADRPATKAVAVGSFGVLGIAAAVVILIVSEGEAFEGVFEGLCDLLSDMLPSSKKPN